MADETVEFEGHTYPLRKPTESLEWVHPDGRVTDGFGNPIQPRPEPKAHSQQDFAEVRGWGYVSGLDAEGAARLIELIPTLGTDTLTWGSTEGREPRVEPDGRVRVAMAYGPVLGAWPADLKKALRRAADRVQPDAEIDVVSTVRDVRASRAEYDALVDKLGSKEAAVKQLRER